MFADETGLDTMLGNTDVYRCSFIVLDNATSIDCSSWPAGEYALRETYRKN